MKEISDQEKQSIRDNIKTVRKKYAGVSGLNTEQMANYLKTKHLRRIIDGKHNSLKDELENLNLLEQPVTKSAIEEMERCQKKSVDLIMICLRFFALYLRAHDYAGIKAEHFLEKNHRFKELVEKSKSASENDIYLWLNAFINASDKWRREMLKQCKGAGAVFWAIITFPFLMGKKIYAATIAHLSFAKVGGFIGVACLVGLSIVPILWNIMDRNGTPPFFEKTRTYPDNRRFENILFRTDSYYIDSAEYWKINQAFTFLKKEPLKKLIVQGHTDNIYTMSHNYELSKSRAKKVLNFFISKGVESKRLFWDAHGERMPLEKNDTAEGRAQNRRVELILIE